MRERELQRRRSSAARDARRPLADLLVITLHWDVLGDKAFVIHHCASLYAFFLMLVSGAPAAGGLRGLPALPTPRSRVPAPSTPRTVPAALADHTFTRV